MRFVTTTNLKDNMVLATPLFDSSFGILLGEGSILNPVQIQRINEMGYAGVYIEDEDSSEIQVGDIVSSAMRMDLIKVAKDIIQKAEQTGPDGSLAMSKAKQEKLMRPIIEALIASPRRFVDLVDIKPYDDYDYYHTANVILLSLLLGLEIGLSGTQLHDLGMSALLHDIGTAFLPKEILHKPGRLTNEEYELIKTHTELGFSFLRDHFDLSIEACLGALHHHENYDGTGYPNGLRRDRISIYGRIISITDVFDAMISRRPYRQPMFPATAMEYLTMNSGSVFDPDLVRSFYNIVALFPAGCTVELSTGARCLVVENYPDNTHRPKLKLKNGLCRLPVILDLRNDPFLESVSVAQIIDQ